VGYIGQRGAFIAANPNVNLAPMGAGQVNPRRQFADSFPQLQNISFRASAFDSQYDAVQLVFQRRFHQGLSLTTHYTRAFATDESAVPWMTFDRASLEFITESGENPNSRPHAWVLQANYALPFGNDFTGAAHALLAGWQVNASTSWLAGRSYSVSNDTERGNTGGSDRPDLVGDPVLPKGDRTVERWFNTDAFVAQPQFTAGNAPTFIDYGPPQRRLDLSFFKDFSLGGARRLQFRYELYNVTNTASFTNPNTSLGNAAFGTINATGNNIPRQMQFALKYLF
jgi:hypothetical protein